MFSMPPIAMKGAASHFKGVWVMSGYFRKLQPGLMLDDVKDLINWEVRGCVNVMEPSAFTIIERASSLGVGARCPLHISSNCWTEVLGIIM